MHIMLLRSCNGALCGQLTAWVAAHALSERANDMGAKPALELIGFKTHTCVYIARLIYVLSKRQVGTLKLLIRSSEMQCYCQYSALDTPAMLLNTPPVGTLSDRCVHVQANLGHGCRHLA